MSVSLIDLHPEFRMVPVATRGILGEPARLECHPPRGHPEAQVAWRKNGNAIDLRRESHSGRSVRKNISIFLYFYWHTTTPAVRDSSRTLKNPQRIPKESRITCSMTCVLAFSIQILAANYLLLFMKFNHGSLRRPGCFFNGWDRERL